MKYDILVQKGGLSLESVTGQKKNLPKKNLAFLAQKLWGGGGGNCQNPFQTNLKKNKKNSGMVH